MSAFGGPGGPHLRALAVRKSLCFTRYTRCFIRHACSKKVDVSHGPLYFILYTLYFILYTLYFQTSAEGEPGAARVLHTVYFTLYTLHFILYSFYFVFCSDCDILALYCILYTVYCILYTLYVIEDNVARLDRHAAWLKARSAQRVELNVCKGHL